MKNAEFEKAIKDLQMLLADLANSGRLTAPEIERFNIDQRSIIAYYNFLTGNVSIVYPWNDPVFIAEWDKWKAYKKQQFKFTYKPIAEQSALRNLAEIANNDMFDAIRIIQKAMANGWMGLFPEKRKALPKPKTTTTYKQSLAQRLIGNQ